MAGAVDPLRLMVAVLRFQYGYADPEITARVGWGAAERLGAGRFPLLDLDAARASVAAGIAIAAGALSAQAGLVPEPLAEAGRVLAGAAETDRVGLAGDWLEDPSGLDPRVAFWVALPGGAVLEAARASIAPPSRREWTGAACPACGGLPQVSVIAPESGEFMGGSPRSLVCGRCAGWWAFPRATCAGCGEDDPRRLAPYRPEGPGTARIDACETCRAYVKTFDLREPGGLAVVPLVDDVATVALDLWARERGLARPVVSFAGV